MHNRALQWCHHLKGRGVPPGPDRELPIFFDLLAEFAAQAGNRDVAAIEERFRGGPAVAVLGRRGVGRGAVAAALANSGVALAGEAADAEVCVLVIAEAIKPEEQAQLRALAPASGSSTATMVVLNKADLTGASAGGPLADAQRRATEFAGAVGRPVVPLMAHLATVGLDDVDVAALRVLAATTADMTSTDAFVGSDHPLPAQLRRRLLDKLDRFGVAHAVRAIAGGATGGTVARQLRALSQVDRVLERLTAVAAPARYRRVRGALRELRTLAVRSCDDRLDAFLTADDVVVAVMAAAVDVVEATGFTLGGGDGEGPDAQLNRAMRWQNVARGPVDLLHQRCATDIARGSLRLLGQLP